MKIEDCSACRVHKNSLTVATGRIESGGEVGVEFSGTVVMRQEGAIANGEGVEGAARATGRWRKR